MLLSAFVVVNITLVLILLRLTAINFPMVKGDLLKHMIFLSLLCVTSVTMLLTLVKIFLMMRG